VTAENPRSSNNLSATASSSEIIISERFPDNCSASDSALNFPSKGRHDRPDS